MSSSKVDILHINESKLDSTVRDNEVYIPGFEIVSESYAEEIYYPLETRPLQFTKA